MWIAAISRCQIHVGCTQAAAKKSWADPIGHRSASLRHQNGTSFQKLFEKESPMNAMNQILATPLDSTLSTPKIVALGGDPISWASLPWFVGSQNHGRRCSSAFVDGIRAILVTPGWWSVRETWTDARLRGYVAPISWEKNAFNAWICWPFTLQPVVNRWKPLPE